METTNRIEGRKEVNALLDGSEEIQTTPKHKEDLLSYFGTFVLPDEKVAEVYGTLDYPTVAYVWDNIGSFEKEEEDTPVPAVLQLTIMIPDLRKTNIQNMSEKELLQFVLSSIS